MDETQGMVLRDQLPTARKPPRPARPWLELACCVAGSFASYVFPALGTLAMVFGAWLLSREQEHKAGWAVAGCLVPGIVLSFVSWWDFGSLVLPCILCALVVALLLPGRVGFTGVVLTCLAVGAAMFGSDAAYVMAQGGDIAAYVDALLDEVRQQTVAALGGSTSSVAVSSTVDQTIEFLGKTWPLLYLVRAVGVVLLGLLGLMLARRDTCQSVYEAFLRYRVPLWGVAALVVAVALLAGESLGLQGAQAMGAVALNLLLCLRVVFFLQGMAVAMCVMDQRRWASGLRVLAIVGMMMAELGLYAVCVFGVLDVWANFRRLAQPSGPQETGPRGEGE